MILRASILALAAAIASNPAGASSGTSAAVQDLTQFSLNELMQINVTSVSRRAERLAEAAAAVYVISNEDIRRSGATSIPEALRLAPGLEVARIDANKWAISARGFNSRFANKLLVMIDGRTVYSPLFSGTFWDRQDLLLEDVERIEVIRGPGATVWGANAVNGVINIISKHARDTQGAYASVGLGTEERIARARYGGEAGPETHYRAFVKGVSRDGGRAPEPWEGNDDWEAVHAGFRIDRGNKHDGAWLVEAGGYAGDVGETFVEPLLTPPYSAAVEQRSDIIGGHMLARWERRMSPDAELSTRISYDFSSFDTPQLTDLRHTLDVDLQYQFKPAANHEFVMGTGYRLTSDEIDGSFAVSVSDASRTDHLFSAFIQDTVQVLPDELYLTFGSKFELNDYSGFEVQPSVKAAWLATPDQTVWASISRAVRTPSRAEATIELVQSVLPPFSPGNPSPLPMVAAAVGSDSFQPEELIAYELGYRVQLGEDLSLDLAGFYNSYDNLRSIEFGAPSMRASPDPHLFIPIQIANDLSGETYGFEVVSRWRPQNWLTFQASYSLLQMDLRQEAGSVEGLARGMEGLSPQHQAKLRVSADLTDELNADLSLRYVDALPAFGIDDYVAAQARLAWRPRPGIELALIGYSSLESSHSEFGAETVAVVPTKVERAALATIDFRF